MKKTISLLIVLVLTLLLIPKAYASNNVVIESITLMEKSDNLIELSKPTTNGMDLGFNLSFLNTGDKAKYEVIISNNSNKDYYIDNETKFSKSNYLTYTYEFSEKGNRINKNSKIKMYITIEYTSQVPPEKLVNGMYTETNEMSVDLSDVILTNPSTYSNIIVLLLIFITLIVITILKITKKKRIGINLLLIVLLLIPITTYALERITVKAETKITIEETRNIIEPRYASGNNHSNRDFWQYCYSIKTITFETKIEEPNNYDYKFDVSEEKNNSIIAYLVKNTENQSYFDLYIMCNGYIYANPNSSYAFSEFTSLTKINGIENYKTTFATTMAGMFAIDLTIEELDLSSFDTSNVTDMNNMFMSRMGTSGHGLYKKINVSTWDTSKVTNMSSMFQYCSELTDLDVSGFDTSNVTDMSYMFGSCSDLPVIDVSTWDTSNVVSMKSLFSGCNSISSLDLSNWHTSNVTNMGAVFAACYNLTELDVSSFDTSNVKDMFAMFSGCEKLTTLDLSNFDTSKVTDMSYMFSNCKELTNLNVSSFNTSQVEGMDYMFNNDKKLKNLDLSSFNTSNVKEMSYMFNNCSNLTDLNITSFNTSKVNGMPSMFSDCSSLVTLDLSSFEPIHVSNMTYMFSNDINLETIYVSNLWNVSSVAYSTNMFANCPKLPNFSSAYTNKERANTSPTGYLTLKS